MDEPRSRDAAKTTEATRPSAKPEHGSPRVHSNNAFWTVVNGTRQAKWRFALNVFAALSVLWTPQRVDRMNGGMQNAKSPPKRRLSPMAWLRGPCTPPARMLQESFNGNPVYVHTASILVEHDERPCLRVPRRLQSALSLRQDKEDYAIHLRPCLICDN